MSFGSGQSSGSHQPTVELNTLAARRGEEIIYTAMDPPPPHHPATHGYPPALTGSGPPPAAGFRGMPSWGCPPGMSGGPMAPSVAVAASMAAAAAGGTMGSAGPFGLLPGSQAPPVPTQSALHMYQHAGRFPPWSAGGAFYGGPGGMGGYPRRFTVLLKVGPREFQGEGGTRQAARNNAAAKALRLLRYMPMPTQALERQQEGGDHPYEHQTSPVSAGAEAHSTRASSSEKSEPSPSAECKEVSPKGEHPSDDLACSLHSSDGTDTPGDSSSVGTGGGGGRRKSDISIVHEIGLKLRQHATFDVSCCSFFPCAFCDYSCHKVKVCALFLKML